PPPGPSSDRAPGTPRLAHRDGYARIDHTPARPPARRTGRHARRHRAGQTPRRSWRVRGRGTNPRCRAFAAPSRAKNREIAARRRKKTNHRADWLVPASSVRAHRPGDGGKFHRKNHKEWTPRNGPMPGATSAAVSHLPPTFVSPLAT